MTIEHIAQHQFSPLRQWSFDLALHVKVFLSAAATEQIIGISTSALASKPAVNIRAIAAITLTIGTATTAGVTLLHMLVEAGHADPTQLTHDHLITVLCLTHMLTHKQMRQNQTTAVSLESMSYMYEDLKASGTWIRAEASKYASAASILCCQNMHRS